MIPEEDILEENEEESYEEDIPEEEEREPTPPSHPETRTVCLGLDENGFITGWGTNLEGGRCVQVTLEQDHPVFLEFPKYRLTEDNELVRDESVALVSLKGVKDEELNKACQTAIESGFYHVIDGITYHFSFDTEAQFNFQGAERLFSTSRVDEINWTVNRDGKYERIKINREIMDDLSLEILLHKDGKISRYRDELLPLVEAAESIEQLQEINWDMDIEAYKQKYSA